MPVHVRTIGLAVLVVLSTALGADAESGREEGARVVEARMEALGQKAREHETTVRRIQDSCVGGVMVNANGGSEVARALMPDCQRLQSDAVRLDAEVRQGIEEARQVARRSGVYPGVVRGLLRRNKLEEFSSSPESPQFSH